MYRSIVINEHSKYLELMKMLETKTKYIEYALVDDEDMRIPEKFQCDIFSEKSVNKWWGTKTSQRCTLYKIAASKKLFAYLKNFSTFCILKTGDWGDSTEPTDFGINDIAFFDDRAEPILYTTTHEGYIELRNDVKFDS